MEAAIRPQVMVAVRFAAGSRVGSFGFRTARTTTILDAAAADVVVIVADAVADVGTAAVVAAVAVDVAVDVADDAADAAAVAVAVAVAAVADAAEASWTGSAGVVGSWIP